MNLFSSAGKTCAVTFPYMPLGRPVFYGVPFDVISPDENDNKTALALPSKRLLPAELPASVDVAVGRSAAVLYFLIASYYTTEEGQQFFRLNYEDGSAHTVDSSEQAFRTCASICFREAFMKASPRLHEPIMAVEIATPDDYIGDIVGDLSRRRGRVLGMRRYRKGSQKISAEAPLMELFGYATTLRSLSSGRANHSMELTRYSPLPEKMAEKVLEEARRRMSGNGRP